MEKCGGKAQVKDEMKKNESQHSNLALSELIRDVKEHLGLILVAEAGHGKSFTAGEICKQAMQEENLTVIVLSPSTIWRRKLWSQKYVKVGTNSFNPIVSTDNPTVESVSWLRGTVHKYDCTKMLVF